MASVALIGPDGVGKTTIGQLLERLSPFRVKYIYMGTNPLSSNIMLPTTRIAAALHRRHDTRSAASAHATGSLTSTAHRGPSVWRTCRRVIRLANRIVDETYRLTVSGLYQLTGRIVVYDRHPLFDCAPPADGELRLMRRIHWWLL